VIYRTIQTPPHMRSRIIAADAGAKDRNANFEGLA